MIEIPAIIKKTWVFPAGDYYIGDPCYVVPDEEWLPLLERTGYFGTRKSAEYDNGFFEYKGQPAFCHGTAHGDGCYSLAGIPIGVDAGLISLIPVNVALPDGGDEPFGTTVETFDKDFEVWYSEGVFHFGDFTIDTN